MGNPNCRTRLIYAPPAPPAQVCNLATHRLTEVDLQQPAALISFQDREVGRP